MNKLKLINEYEGLVKELIFEYVVKYYEFINKRIEILEYEFQNFINQIVKNNYYEVDDLDKIGDLLEVVNIKLEKTIGEVKVAKKNFDAKVRIEVIDYQLNILDKAANNKEQSLLIFRVKNFKKYVMGITTDFSDKVEKDFEDLIKNRTNDILEYVDDNIEKKYNAKIDAEYNEYVKSVLDLLNEHGEFDRDNEQRKIFDYKEMVKKAESNGYAYKWSKGSHNIFEHIDSQKIVVIPSHNLGKGLSKKILKQIEDNKF